MPVDKLGRLYTAKVSKETKITLAKLRAQVEFNYPNADHIMIEIDTKTGHTTAYIRLEETKTTIKLEKDGK